MRCHPTSRSIERKRGAERKGEGKRKYLFESGKNR